MSALEARVSEVETCHGESIYRLERKTTRTDLNVLKILKHMGLPETTEAEVDEVLDGR
jgi:hypothetical protein